MTHVIERTNDNVSINTDNRRRWAVIFAKLGIASGLCALLVSVTIYGLEESIYKSIEDDSVENQEFYRLKKIGEYDYHTQLKYATLQKL